MVDQWLVNSSRREIKEARCQVVGSRRLEVKVELDQAWFGVVLPVEFDSNPYSSSRPVARSKVLMRCSIADIAKA